MLWTALAWSKPAGLCDELFKADEVLSIEELKAPPFWSPIEPTRISEVLKQIQVLNNEDSKALDSKLRELMHVADDSFDKRAPQKINEKSQAQMAKAMNLTNIGDVFTVRAGFSKAPRLIDTQKAKILSTLDGILQGNYVKDQEMTDLRLMADLIRDLKPRAETIRADTGRARKVIEATLQYLNSSKKEIRKHFEDPEAKPLLMLMPEYNPSKKEYFLTMRVVHNPTRFDEVIKALEKQRNQFKDINTRMGNYEQDYIDLHYLATTFLNIERSKFRYHTKTAQDGSKTSHRDEVEGLFRELDDAFANEKEIHPNLWEVRWLQGKEFVKTGFRRTWKKITGGILFTGVIVAIFTQPEFFFDKGARAYNSARDNQNIENPDYWIEKCSKQTNLKKIQDCLEGYQDNLMAYTQKLIDKKQEENPKYPGKDELLKSQQQFQKVLNGVIPIEENAPDRLELAMSVYRKFAIEYQIQGYFNKWKILLKRLEEEEAAKAVAKQEEPKPITPPVPLPPPSIDFLKQSIEEEAKALRLVMNDKDKSNADKIKANIDYMDKMTALKAIIEKTNQEFEAATQDLIKSMVEGSPDEKDIPNAPTPQELRKIDLGSALTSPSPAPTTGQ